ncbi:hypothetical protein [Bailinhaonella thermotolerans]|uniref:Uncharacterized protein n=1 Tax=Bailinhaonella thermotolerans TaxID=1070861 RepID=A0A3A4B9K5_9ACTN|nr:hypothetical protein [Bailinhaonella thermotolerans]RJL35569.1 hypothetical protein D5H75_01885 [Bailinhaonella thermotolerans]
MSEWGDRVEGRPSPWSSGVLVTPDGRIWRARRGDADLRVADRLIRRPDVPFVVGWSGGFEPAFVSAEERAGLWRDLRRSFAGPGSRGIPGTPSYRATWFACEDGGELIYLEEHC